MIELAQLIRAAPFGDEMRQELLSRADSLSPAKRRELEELCWSTIAQWYRNEVRGRQELAVLEMAQGVKSHSREEIAGIAETVLDELATRLGGGTHKASLQEIREGLRAAKPLG